MEKDTPGKKAAAALSNFVNGMGNDKRGFVEGVTKEHRFLQQEMFDLFFSCMLEWSTYYEEDNYDGRNEHACKLSNEIMEAILNK